MKSIVATAAMLLASTSAFAAVHTVEAGPDAQERLQEALIIAEPGDTVEIGAGRFELTDGLSLDVDGVTVRGAGPDESVLDFSNQVGSGEGLLVTSDDVVLRDFAVENTRGDGIKSKEADRIVYHNIRVEWTRGPHPDNGAYGIYPVESTHVLVDGTTVIGSSDAGIYVGQSEQIVVRNNSVHYNVAGIEIENSFHADVYDNIATHNTGGILVFDLPSIPQVGGHSVRLFRNFIHDNNTENFAHEGNIVATVPAGMGVMVMAHRNVEVFDNIIADHGSGNILMVAYPNDYDDDRYNPYPLAVTIRNNLYGPAGYNPDFDGGTELQAALGGDLPPIIWDGQGEDILVADDVGILSLGLTRLRQPFEEAQPAPADLSTGTGSAPLEGVTLPDSMEAVLR